MSERIVSRTGEDFCYLEEKITKRKPRLATSIEKFGNRRKIGRPFRALGFPTSNPWAMPKAGMDRAVGPGRGRGFAVHLPIGDSCGHQSSQGRRQLGIDDKPHGLPGDQNRMVGFSGGISQARGNVLRFQIRIIGQDFRFRDSCRQQIKKVFHPNPHSPDTRTSSALIRIEGDPVCRL